MDRQERLFRVLEAVMLDSDLFEEFEITEEDVVEEIRSGIDVRRIFYLMHEPLGEMVYVTYLRGATRGERQKVIRQLGEVVEVGENGFKIDKICLRSLIKRGECFFRYDKILDLQVLKLDN